MKYFKIGTGNIQDFEDKFIEFINESAEDDWSLFIDNGGGEIGTAHLFTAMVKEHIARGKTVSFIVSSAYSSAFLFIWQCREICDFSFIKNGAILHHYPTLKIAIDCRWKAAYTQDLFLKKRHTGTSRKESEEIARVIMTPKQYRKFKKGKDVFIYNSEIVKHFPKGKIQ